MQVGPEAWNYAIFQREFEARIARDGSLDIVVIGTNAMSKVMNAVVAAEANAQVEAAAATANAVRARLAVILVEFGGPAGAEAAALSAGRKEDGKAPLQPFHLRIRPTQQVPAPAVSGELRMAAGSNTGKIAGAMAHRLRSDGCAVVNGAGAVAIRQSWKAVHFLSKYMGDSPEHETSDVAVMFSLQEQEDRAAGLPPLHKLIAFWLPR